MDYRASIVASCWLAVAVISSVYMWLLADKVEIFFGIILPVGALVFVAFIVTLMVISRPESRKE